MGFRMSEPAGPLCDKCLLERNVALGMLLIMANVNRELANQPKPDDPLEADLPKVAPMTFSMIYDQVQVGPWHCCRSEATRSIRA